MKIYTLGYSGWPVEAIKTFLESVNGAAVDVRMTPRSRVAAFNGTAFSRLLGERYYWLSDFGNVNYKTIPPDMLGLVKAWATMPGAAKVPIQAFCTLPQAAMAAMVTRK